MSARARISSACHRRRLPASVRAIRRFFRPRAKSLVPSSASNSMSWRERVGWVTWSTSAAAEMLSAWATVRKYRSTRSSMGPPPFLALDLV